MKRIKKIHKQGIFQLLNNSNFLNNQNYIISNNSKRMAIRNIKNFWEKYYDNSYDFYNKKFIYRVNEKFYSNNILSNILFSLSKLFFHNIKYKYIIFKKKYNSHIINIYKNK